MVCELKQCEASVIVWDGNIMIFFKGSHSTLLFPGAACSTSPAAAAAAGSLTWGVWRSSLQIWTWVHPWRCPPSLAPSSACPPLSPAASARWRPEWPAHTHTHRQGIMIQQSFKLWKQDSFKSAVAFSLSVDLGCLPWQTSWKLAGLSCLLIHDVCFTAPGWRLEVGGRRPERRLEAAAYWQIGDHKHLSELSCTGGRNDLTAASKLHIFMSVVVVWKPKTTTRGRRRHHGTLHCLHVQW